MHSNQFNVFIIGNNIASILKSRNISVRKMAMDLNMDYSMAHSLVNRKSLMHTQLITLVKIATYLDIDLEELFSLKPVK